ncbi:MAG TPA: YfiR family protein [Candidatus Krumholzibacteria bacterium]|nr:YfiR family protein [Candidatus Krumholzibacteria bacterium]HRX51394.1 YfiR family protein [Candidatus Krumholzibacteria bacterium]
MMLATRQERRCGKAGATALALVLLVIAAWPAVAADSRQDVDAVKAALVFNFTRYTSWPEDVEEGTPLRVGVLGDEDLHAALRAIDGQKSGQRTLEVRRVENAADAAALDVVFLAGNDRESWLALRSAIGGRPVLTIGEMNGFLDAGGHINLVLEDDRFRFEVNLADARDAGLKISSRLLKLARKVKE